MNIIEKQLFESNAIKIANENSPFWYTSGTIGPYFINTHFLFGGENIANELLDFIDKNSEKENFTTELKSLILEFFYKNETFKNVMIEFYDSIKNIKEFKESNYISGGERRDWYFSIPIAELSGKKHLFIFKDLKVRSENQLINDIQGKSVAHIADLITQASSYERAWIPAIKNINGNLKFTASIVDRNQGGKEFLNNIGIFSYSSIVIDEKFFENALKNSVINEKQLKLINDFHNDSNKYGIDFILNNPQFLLDSLNSAEKSVKSKAQRCINENPYEIDIKRILEG